ncbi:MAG: UDP-N-acetylglucosamine 1-carboxyvinyltransferase [Candidatus Omnitrophota bacterium]|nr:MAG: UDP-N-acetylglucosamine 1-carboxyvinyltransferase [Candidatus Omnitrophota bacterium]
MDKLVIEGGRKLKGTVQISGAKNAALPILAATLLTQEKCVISNVPPLRDVQTMVKILRSLGVRVQMQDSRITVYPAKYKGYTAPYKLVSTMRASICVLGPLLAKQALVRVSLPGGCVIGPRPIDLHLKGLSALGAKIKIEHGYIVAQGKKMKGARIYLGGPFGSSVLATANVMMAATLTPGITIIENAACEPEVVDLANFLLKMGAKIHGQKTHTIEIEGVKKLHGAEHKIINDRIEAGTYMLACAITGGEISIKGASISHLGVLIDKLKGVGTTIRHSGDTIFVKATRRLRPVDITTLPFPGFPTDLQAQMMVLMCMAGGISVITEKVYPERFMHISELNRMGARVMKEGSSAIIEGVPKLSGAPVMASDLRASAALVLAGLAASGRTEISRVYHLDRGYKTMEEKLSRLGAKIWREKE